MLSENSKISEKARLKKLPPIDPPRNIRLKFRKVGSLQYTSHLDLQRTFNRVLVRTSIPVWYTKGFNPHIKLVFSTPLSVGSQSECEYLDIKIDREMSCGEIMERLNYELTEELCITDVYYPIDDFSEIGYAEYDMKIHTVGNSEKMAEDIKKILTTSPLMLTKRTKAGDKEIDIIPLIKSIDVRYSSDEDTVNINTVLRASATEFLNPEMLVTALKNSLGILSTDLSKEWYEIVRKEIFKEDMAVFR